MRYDHATIDQALAPFGTVERTPTKWAVDLGRFDGMTLRYGLRFFYTDTIAMLVAEVLHEVGGGQFRELAVVFMEVHDGAMRLMNVTTGSIGIPSVFHRPLAALADILLDPADHELFRQAIAKPSICYYPARCEALGLPVNDYTIAPGVYAMVRRLIDRAVKGMYLTGILHDKTMAPTAPIVVDHHAVTFDVTHDRWDYWTINIHGPLGAWYSHIHLWSDASRKHVRPL